MSQFAERFDCGCRLADDADGILHLYPCRDDCPMVAALKQVVADLCHGLRCLDLRPAEEMLGRQLSSREAEEVLRLFQERS